ncbi:MAG: ABC transporter substrate-binding protein [Bdellovibrionaceae bacterium]|nr:ABC transporter substrate-binding protein [Pseudobdellovibrionaceae bacterium]
MTLTSRLLWGRFLTRSGDQAWDFAVPLTFLAILPGELRIAALYYFLVRLALVFFLPRLTRLIDEMDRYRVTKLGIFLQLAGVLIGFGAVLGLSLFGARELLLGGIPAYASFVVMVFGGVLASLGSSFMDIAIANDLVPSSLNADQLGAFNSHLRQVDLATEVGAPILAGLLLLVGDANSALIGFSLIALWNTVSFIPEYLLLRSIYHDRPDLLSKPPKIEESAKLNAFQKFALGWKQFAKEPVAMVVTAYSFLWLSVLSPHGVLLTAYLKDAWKLPEWEIGIFRGAGAIFGLAATVAFPVVIKKYGLVLGSGRFLFSQTAMVIAALLFFLMDSRVGQIGFLLFVLLSRIGLYGFSMGEMQIRQLGIPPRVRGEVNGFAGSLTAIATLVLFGMGSALSETSDFKYLVLISVASVVAAFIIYGIWTRQENHIQKIKEIS